MHKLRSTLPIPALLGAVLVMACGSGDSPAEPPDPEPQTTTLTLDLNSIEVIEDCDGIEGDGDFQFVVAVGQLGALTTIFEQTISLPPGGTTQSLGRRSYTFGLGSSAGIVVVFNAWEWDRDIFGTTYADSRLAGVGDDLTHVLSSGTWSRLGSREITLGDDGCRVQLTWTATAE